MASAMLAIHACLRVTSLSRLFSYLRALSSSNIHFLRNANIISIFIFPLCNLVLKWTFKTTPVVTKTFVDVVRKL